MVYGSILALNETQKRKKKQQARKALEVSEVIKYRPLWYLT